MRPNRTPIASWPFGNDCAPRERFSRASTGGIVEIARDHRKLELIDRAETVIGGRDAIRLRTRSSGDAGAVEYVMILVDAAKTDDGDAISFVLIAPPRSSASVHAPFDATLDSVRFDAGDSTSMSAPGPREPNTYRAGAMSLAPPSGWVHRARIDGPGGSSLEVTRERMRDGETFSAYAERKLGAVARWRDVRFVEHLPLCVDGRSAGLMRFAGAAIEHSIAMIEPLDDPERRVILLYSGAPAPIADGVRLTFGGVLVSARFPTSLRTAPSPRPRSPLPPPALPTPLPVIPFPGIYR